MPNADFKELKKGDGVFFKIASKLRIVSHWDNGVLWFEDGSFLYKMDYHKVIAPISQKDYEIASVLFQYIQIKLKKKETSEKKKGVKPPLGLVPKKITLELRLKEINEAIKRYLKANKVIPSDWIDERSEIIVELGL